MEKFTQPEKKKNDFEVSFLMGGDIALIDSPDFKSSIEKVFSIYPHLKGVENIHSDEKEMINNELSGWKKMITVNGFAVSIGDGNKIFVRNMKSGDPSRKELIKKAVGDKSSS